MRTLPGSNCFGERTWDGALSVCNDLADGQCGLTDGSEPGDWRLPNVRELESLIHFGYSNPALPNTEGTGQWTEGDPFTGVQSDGYWSSSTFANLPDNAWIVDLNGGGMGYDNKAGHFYVWPVRGRQ